MNIRKAMFESVIHCYHCNVCRNTSVMRNSEPFIFRRQQTVTKEKIFEYSTLISEYFAL